MVSFLGGGANLGVCTTFVGGEKLAACASSLEHGRSMFVGVERIKRTFSEALGDCP